MNKLLNEILQWMQINGYRRASYDRLCGIIPSAATYEQLDQLLLDFPNIFRSARLKGGLDGLALHDNLTIEAAIAKAAPPPAEEEILMQVETLTPTGRPVPPAPEKVTINQVEGEIVDEYYRNLGSAVKAPVGSPIHNVTICVLVLRNGFTVVGKSACVDPLAYDENLGRSLAREDAIKQIWPLLGFRLADKLRLAA